MNKKLMGVGLLLFAVLVLSIPGAVVASDDEYEAYNLTIQPGSNETELNFTWFTATPTDIPQLVVCNEGGLKGGKCTNPANYYKGALKNGNHSKCMNYYQGEYEIVVVEESGPGEPGGSSSDTDDTEEDDTEIYACKVTMTNVKNNTKYTYVVGNGEIFSDIPILFGTVIDKSIEQ
ncbi:hypothetical protein [Desulfosarcina ovata]|uniref:Ig-like domain-containing protein n=1 Tax=Desulfosarcina ovata subsp. ovata TaxID=2752305 RepID=A0A5K8A672_9BACT|nr:hypothetical protein [Desulfosarcina ovata]BBO87884.1 hypothetical protein DSCOOX_10640 [Desulfosarcina ovata subsp. ovata]